MSSQQSPIAAKTLPDALRLVDTTVAAEILHIEFNTLQNWRSLGRGPKFVKIGSRVRYCLSDLLTYIESHSHENTGAAA